MKRILQSGAIFAFPATATWTRERGLGGPCQPASLLRGNISLATLERQKPRAPASALWPAGRDHKWLAFPLCWAKLWRHHSLFRTAESVASQISLQSPSPDYTSATLVAQA